MKTPIETLVAERAALQPEVDARARRNREAGETLAALKALPAELKAKARGPVDAEERKAIEVELIALPVRTELAQDDFNDSAAALAEVEDRRGQLDNEIRMQRMEAERVDFVARGEASAEEIVLALLVLGREAVGRDRLCDEMDAFRKRAAQYGIVVPPLPRPHELAEVAFVRARSAGGPLSAWELRVPVPA